MEKEFNLGTTTIQTADKDGWIVSITPSGGWIPAVIAGNTGIGLSQRAQSFVLYEDENPYNVIEPGKRPRATLTPALAIKDKRPFLSFAVQGGDTQDQNLLQFFLNMVEFEMNFLVRISRMMMCLSALLFFPNISNCSRVIVFESYEAISLGFSNTETIHTTRSCTTFRFLKATRAVM